jgi:hypothetical protein
LTVLLPTLTWTTQQERERRSVAPAPPWGSEFSERVRPRALDVVPCESELGSRVRVLLPGRKQQRARACASDLTRFG